MRAIICACVCVVIELGMYTPRAHARREVTFSYPYSRVWTTAVRLMRVDFESEIKEKDKEDGYFLFEFPDRGKTHAGSMELVTVKQDDVESVRVVLTIQALPTYVENMVLERLARKLTQEFGPPPERKPEKRPAPDSSPNQDGDEAPAEPEQRPKRATPKPSREAERHGSREDGE